MSNRDPSTLGEPSIPDQPSAFRVYSADVPFSGNTHFPTEGDRKRSYARCDLYPGGNQFERLNANYQTAFSYSIPQPIPGPGYAKVLFRLEINDSDFPSEWYTTGWFYVLTPPE
ncbi:hypothetical protein KW841_15960 [Pseudomonas sp. PDM28]|uniref:hypothetical protein n=1 Tax=Pseudomonas sp. PDM28 TaxID=2854770 RepID=UPI001C459263|nr:hypothetical protein [Pseudomonas sp. PDM28]MBV7553845.1 hypothetical protein [Pseudomonas sp. PDM28]